MPFGFGRWPRTGMPELAIDRGAGAAAIEGVRAEVETVALAEIA